MNIARGLIDDGYNVEKYGSVYGNYDFRIRPPSIDALEEDPTLLPPKPLQTKAGRPKGKRKMNRSNVVGERNVITYIQRAYIGAGGRGHRRTRGGGHRRISPIAGPNVGPPSVLLVRMTYLPNTPYNKRSSSACY